MASRYFVNGGVDNNWGTTGNWALSSGGAGGQAVPLSTDDVFLDANSPNCVLDASARVAKTLNCTSYVSLLTFDQQLSVSGSITIVAAMSFAGATTNKLRMIAAGTWTTNGKTIPQDVEIGGTTTFTCTLADALVSSGDLFLTNTSSTIFSGAFEITATNATISGSQTLTIVEDFNIQGLTTISDANIINGAFQWRTRGLTTTGDLSGTATVVFNGTGTWTGAAGTLKNSTTINTAGTLTISGVVLYNTGTLTYTAGTVVVAGSTLSNNALLATLNVSGMTWNNITLTGGVTVTLSSNLTLTGLLTVGSTTVTTTLTGNTINAGGGLKVEGTTSIISGTTAIVMNGTGTWSSDQTTGTLRLNLTFNAPGSTITISGTVRCRGNTITYTAGTMSVAGSTLDIPEATTLNTGAMNWASVEISGSSIYTVTLSSALNGTGALSLTNTTTQTFSGAFEMSFSSCTLSGTKTVNISGHVNITGDTTVSDAHTVDGAFE